MTQQVELRSQVTEGWGLNEETGPQDYCWSLQRTGVYVPSKLGLNPDPTMMVLQGGLLGD